MAPSVIVRRIPDLAHGNGSKPAGKSRIGKTSARLAAIGGADLVLEAVHRGQPVGDFRRTLDAPARAAVKVLAICAAARPATRRAASRTMWLRRKQLRVHSDTGNAAKFDSCTRVRPKATGARSGGLPWRCVTVVAKVNLNPKSGKGKKLDLRNLFYNIRRLKSLEASSVAV